MTTIRSLAAVTRRPQRRAAPPAAALAVASMLCLQVGVAASTALFDDLGPYGTTWLRLSWAAVLFAVLARPRLHRIDRSTLAAAVALGTATGGMTLAFFGAIERIPLGTASSIEMLGALGVAAVAAPRWRTLVWPALALAGVVAMTRPWAGGTDLVGLGLALAAAACLAAYVLLTQRVGDRLDGVQALALTMPVAALVAAPLGLPEALPALDLRVVLAGAVLALAVPVVPYALELLALRRLSVTAFGTLMGVEPAIALGVGALLLAQHPGTWQLAGVGAVVVAGLGAQRTRRGGATRTAGRDKGARRLRPGGQRSRRAVAAAAGGRWPSLDALHPALGKPGGSRLAAGTSQPGASRPRRRIRLDRRAGAADGMIVARDGRLGRHAGRRTGHGRRGHGAAAEDHAPTGRGPRDRTLRRRGRHPARG